MKLKHVERAMNHTKENWSINATKELLLVRHIRNRKALSIAIVVNGEHNGRGQLSV